MGNKTIAIHDLRKEGWAILEAFRVLFARLKRFLEACPGSFQTDFYSTAETAIPIIEGVIGGALDRINSDNRSMSLLDANAFYLETRKNQTNE